VSDLVVDCSLSLAWYLEDEQSDYADAVLKVLPTKEAVVPPLWRYEIANGLLLAERRGRTTIGAVPRILALFEGLPIRVDATGHERARREVLDLARQEKLTTYDAAYLELALREGVPLATLDTDLKAAAARVGVAEFEPS